MGSSNCVFIETYELAEGGWEDNMVRGAERIDTERFLKAHDDYSEAERIEPRVQQKEIIGQGRKMFFVVIGNASKLRFDCGSYICVHRFR
jgi:hypothetical protein